MTRPRHVRGAASALFACAAAMAIAPGTAAAAEQAVASYDYQTRTVRFVGTDGVDQVKLVLPWHQEYYEVWNTSASIKPGPGCAEITTRIVRCGPTPVPGERVRVDFLLGAGHDSLTTTVPLDGKVQGMGGNDWWYAKDDHFFGGTSSLEFEGDEGGGDGVDYSDYLGMVEVSLDGIPGDGRPGDDDDIASSVDNIVGTSYGDVLEGDDGSNVITPGPGADIVRGLGGADLVKVRDGVADLSIDCGTGTDTLQRDSIDPRSHGCENLG